MISTIKIRGFRGITSENEDAKLSFARITLFSGRNGLGKTTVFDAIDWCLFGSAWRLGDQEEAVRNLYYPELTPRVSLTLNLENVETTIVRTLDGVTVNGQEVTEKGLLDVLVNDSDLFPPYYREIGRRVRETVYLPQSEIRKIASPENDKERAALFQTLLGVPNASLLEHSISRVEDRILLRQRDLNYKQKDFQDRIDNLSRQGQDRQPGSLHLRADLITTVGELVGTADAGTSASELLSLSRGALQALGTRRIELEGLQQYLGEIRDAQKAGQENIARLEQTEASLQIQSVSFQRELESVTQIREQLAKEALEQDEELQIRTREKDTLARRLVLLQELNDARRRAAQLSQEVSQADQELASKQRSVRDTQEKLSALRKSIDSDRNAVSQLQGVIEGFRRRDDLTKQRSKLTKEIAEADGMSRGFVDTAKRLREEIVALRNQVDVAETAISKAQSARSLHMQLSNLTSEIGHLIEQLSLKECPLCGHEYQNSSDLFQHISAASVNRKNRDEQFEALSTSRGKTVALLSGKEGELARTEDGLERAQLDSEQRNSRIDMIENELALLELPDDCDRPDDQSLQFMQQAISGKEKELSDSQALVNALRSEIALLEAKLSDLIQRRATNQTTMQRIESQIGNIADGEPQTSQLAIRSEERTIQSLEKAKTEKGAKLKDAETRAKQVLSQRTTVGTNLFDVRARLASDRQRLSALSQQLNKRTQALLGVESSGDLLNEILKKRQELSSAEDRLRTVVAELERYVAAERYDALTAQLNQLQQDELRVSKELDRLNRAQSRFTELSKAVRKRSQIEAQQFASRINDALQEFYSALYPHRHLDHVLWSGAQLLLSDSELSSAVQPHLYTSTGQLNTLAISVFLAVALRQRLSVLRFVMLDEPVQNLSDVNFLAFMTLIKRVALSRTQVILSTADKNIADLFKRQMVSSRWTRQDGNFTHWEWLTFDTHDGPRFVQADVEAPSPRRESLPASS